MLNGFLAFLCLVAFSTQSLASGKLNFKPIYDQGTKETKYSLGLSVYERPMKYVGFVGWFGGGSDADGKDSWLKSDTALESYIGAAALAIGFAAEHKLDSDDTERQYYVKISTRVW